MLTCPGKIIDANNELKTKSLGIKRQRDNSKQDCLIPEVETRVQKTFR
jgi:hypothetical protein